MTVQLNGRFLTQPITGVQRYAIELVKSLDKKLSSAEIDGGKFKFTVLTPKKNIVTDLTLNNIEIKPVGYLNGHLWEQFELPFYSGNDLLVNLCNTAPVLKKKQIVTIHDAGVFVYPQNFSKLFSEYYRTLLPIIGKRSRRIITDSDFSKSELSKYCHINPEKLNTIYLGKEQILEIVESSEILDKYGLNNKKFVFSIGSMTPNKNFNAVVKAVRLLDGVDFKFVAAGGTNPKVFSNSAELPENVIHLGYINDQELKALYQNASCFVFPSLYEGFGLPPLEAMACGCPVISSNAASLPEVCGDAVLYIDPHRPEDIAAKIKQVLSDDSLRNELKRKGLERAREFSWEKCADEFWEIIKQEIN
jgi:glycosyltransferase involved in cell wall biosynthesis